ncbi:Rho GDP dissociation inhibitor [Fasciolopsis buskii]|uniref:Rho GDP dissociation inhibitor n=1 Tax=Fasciolopsis buskii TaxID=27845 RepID=A0A8E0VIM0_9TREM|nr:Rho GDP dissociation inhibitor [Fasciolopsis buski]
MADQPEEIIGECDGTGYRAPQLKSLNEIRKLDQEDESLKRYKAALLGSIELNEVPCPENPKCVVIDSFSICVDGQGENKISLRGALENLRSNPIPIPEGASYHILVRYYVQRDIVTGLQYEHTVHRGPLRVDNSTVMVGSYGPQKDLREWKSETYTAPKGAMHRGTYNVKSRFRDIDKNDFITWKWAINVVKSPTSTD